MTKEPSSPLNFTVSTTKSDGRTWLHLKRSDGASAALSCQTSASNGETITSQIVTEFANSHADALEGGVTVTDEMIEKAHDAFHAFPRPGYWKDKMRATLQAALSAPAQRVEEGKPVAEIILKTLRDYRQTEVADEDGNGYPLVDALTLKGRGIDMGEREIDNIVSELMYAISPFLAASPASAPYEAEKWKRAFAAQSRKLQAVLHIPGVKEALADLDHTAPAPHAGVDAEFPDYDAGLLNDFGGGDVSWWQDYLRAEIERANQHWRAALEDRT